MTLIKILIVLWGDWPCPLRSNWTWNSTLISFWVVRAIGRHQLKSRFPNFDKNTSCTVKVRIDLGLDWPLSLVSFLTHWGRATHICVGKLTIIGSDNGLSPGRRQAIILTIAGILLIGPLETNFSEILIGIQTFSIKKMQLKMSSAKWRPFVSASMC